MNSASLGRSDSLHPVRSVQGVCASFAASTSVLLVSQVFKRSVQQLVMSSISTSRHELTATTRQTRATGLRWDQTLMTLNCCLVALRPSKLVSPGHWHCSSGYPDKLSLSHDGYHALSCSSLWLSGRVCVCFFVCFCFVFLVLCPDPKKYRQLLFLETSDPKSDDSYRFWTPPTPKVMTVSSFEYLRPQKWWQCQVLETSDPKIDNSFRLSPTPKIITIPGFGDFRPENWWQFQVLETSDPKNIDSFRFWTLRLQKWWQFQVLETSDPKNDDSFWFWKPPTPKMMTLSGFGKLRPHKWWQLQVANI